MKYFFSAGMLLFYLSIFPIFAQHQPTDSLETLLARTGADTNRIKLLNELTNHYWSKAPEKVLRNAEESQTLSRKLHYSKGEAGSLVSFGIYYWSQGMPDKALEAYTQALNIYQTLNDPKGTAKCYSNIGMVNKDKGAYSVAMDYYFKALKMHEALGDRSSQANTMNSIGVLLKQQRKYDQALDYYNRSLIILRDLGDSTSYAGGLSNIGSIYKIKGDSVKAIEYLNRSLQLFEKLNNPRGKVVCYNGLGDIYIAGHQYARADTSYEKALAIADKNGYKTQVLAAMLGLGAVRLATDQAKGAKEYFERALQLASGLKLRKELQAASQGLAEASAQVGDFRTAFDYQSQAAALKDSIFNEENTRKIADIQASYESEKKAAEIKLLKEEQSRDRAVRNLFAVALVGSLAIGGLVISRQRLKIRIEKALLEKNQEVLRNQQALAEAERSNSQMKEQQLQLELEYRNKELTTRTLNTIQKNALMEELREAIHEVLSSTAASDRNSSLKFGKLIKLIDYSFSLDKDWDEFKMYFEQVHKDFFVRLKEQYPDLTSGELRLCALIKLNLNLKEAATILGISPESVKTARHRLRKKLNLPEELNLTDFLITA